MENVNFVTWLAQELYIASKKQYLSSVKRKVAAKAAPLAYHLTHDIPESAKDPYSPQATSLFLKVKKWNCKRRSEQDPETLMETLNEIEKWQKTLYTPDYYSVITELSSNIRLIDPIKKDFLPAETVERLDKIFGVCIEELNARVRNGSGKLEDVTIQLIVQLNEHLNIYNGHHLKTDDTGFLQVAHISEKTKRILINMSQPNN